ncbi:hypothetical protein Leryth_013339 [Lithospermum erythrorhizon]|nr:hypothetical protein Leryth_013339 [Lithospermum erythrorhizon]
MLLGSDRILEISKEITLADARVDDIMGFRLYNKYYEGNSSESEVYISTHTPVKDVLSPDSMHIDIGRSPSRDTRNMNMGLENMNKSMFCLDDRLEPMTFEDSEHERGLQGLHEIDLQIGGEQINLGNIREISSSNNTANLKMGLENLNKSIFVLDDRMEPMTFDEPEIEGDLHGLFGKEIQTGGEKANIDNLHEISPSRNTTNLKMGLENINKSIFVLDDRMEPMTFDEPENLSGFHGLFEKEIQTGGGQTNIENVHESRVFSEELLQPLTFGKAEKHSGLPDKNIHTDRKNSVTEIHLEEEDAANTKLVDNEENVEAEIVQNPGVTSSGSRVSQTQKDHHVSIIVGVTPQSKFQAPSGKVLPEVLAVRTPAAKERKRITMKRKCYYDDQLVVPNEIFKCWINDPSDLVCKRRKVQHTAFSLWEAQKISGLPGNFLEPLISCNSLDFRYLIGERTHRSEKGYQPASSSSVDQNQSVPTLLKEQNESGSSLSREQNQTAPLLFEEHNQSAPSFPEEQNQTSPSFPGQPNQTAPLLSEEQIKCSSLPSIIKFSYWLREGPIAPSISTDFRYLYGFAHKKPEGDEVIKLSQVVKGKNKKESAMLFYEILVLKTKDYINVRQKKAYEDIQVMQTPALKLAFQVES